MNRFHRGNAAAIAALFACSCGLAVAQTPPDAGTQPPGAIGAAPAPLGQDPRADLKSLLGELDIGQMIMSIGGMAGQTVDFTHSAERVIVKRGDVTAALQITAKQREKFGKIDADGQKRLVPALMQAMTAAIKANPIQPSPEGAPPDSSQIKVAANKGWESMTAAIQALQIDLDAKSEEILTPKQLQRLHQLDLQWRGPLALSDKWVAASLNITQDQQAVVHAALKDFETVYSNAIKPVMQQALNSPGLLSGRPNMNATQAHQATIDALQNDDLKKARAADENKVLAVLTPEQKAQWVKMQGPKFAFHIED